MPERHLLESAYTFFRVCGAAKLNALPNTFVESLKGSQPKRVLSEPTFPEIQRDRG
jgi:hypothetical protein